MIYIVILIITVGASLIGAVSGVGGGVIIKPLLDSFGIMSVADASFLSGCTVLSMSFFCVVKSRVGADSNISIRVSTALAIGSVLGGIIGKGLFQSIWDNAANKDVVGLIQALCMVVITVATLIYTIKMKRISTHCVKNLLATTLLGLVLGVLSSFLGIGGGPINLIVLYFFFSMEIKVAAENSLYIIMFSQISSLLRTILTNTVPNVRGLILILMICGGIAGAVIGRKINKTIRAEKINKMFIGLMSAIIIINIYNVFRFL